MQAWVIVDSDNQPIAIRENEQDAINFALDLAKLAIRDDDEHMPEEAETLIAVPEFDGDNVVVKIYTKANRDIPYMAVSASKFNSTTPVFLH